MPWRNPNQQPALPDLSLQSEVASLPWAQDYLAHYGLDFENRVAGLKHYLGAFDSSGERIACQVFSLPGATQTAFIYHGYYDHVGLFDNVIAYCLKHACSVVAYDLPGHGLSTGERASTRDFLLYRQALRDAFAAVAHFGLPESRIALAQSTGCAVLNSHLLDGGSSDFEKVVLMAPLVKPVALWWGSPAHSVLKFFKHSLPRKFAVNSADLAFLEFLQNHDPLQHRFLPLSWVGALKKWLPWFNRLPPLDFPVLILQGDKDTTVDWRHNLAVLKKKYPSAQLVMIPGARHHLVKESEAHRARLWQACDAFLFAGKSGHSEATPLAKPGALG